ncbi:helix-turn-helix domain-containing protein [Brevundimonas sp.]|uniref:IclR family transcriptional regulator n=1 Tax=Brevundimonas sp. TaxID=1871086 RepID=UPI00289CA3FE|nr:helix-turn-helix domain-containing protein [Brevundimonas sp.]
MTERRSVKSAERALAVFELFSRERRALTIGYISTKLGIPQPSVSMLIQNFVDLGYIDYNRANRTCIPTIRIALLGMWIDRQFKESGTLSAEIAALQVKVGETAFLGIQNGAAAQYIIRQAEQVGDALMVKSGQFRSLTYSAMGRALLARKTDAEVASWVHRSNAEAADPKFKILPSDFKAIITEIRKQGYATTDGDVTPGYGAIAIAFDSPIGQTLAVGVGGGVDRIESKREAIVEALHTFIRNVDARFAAADPARPLQELRD